MPFEIESDSNATKCHTGPRRWKLPNFSSFEFFVNIWCFKIKYKEINEDNDGYETEDHSDDEPDAVDLDPRYAVEQNSPISKKTTKEIVGKQMLNLLVMVERGVLLPRKSLIFLREMFPILEYEISQKRAPKSAIFSSYSIQMIYYKDSSLRPIKKLLLK